MRAPIFVLSFTSLLSGAAFAQTEPSPSPMPAAPALAGTEQPAAEKLVCLDEDAGGNSRLGSHRVCHTQKEWASLARARR